ncbi:MAG: ArsR family transcriptional regulator [Bacteroidia bacterium]|nr:MAG: ArsR family transcriptional regulator [Bacteroidia bacterium]
MNNKDQYTDDNLETARLCKALAHPARISIIKLLLSKDCCVCGDIVKELPLAQSTVSQHLKELKNAGIIRGNITPPKVKYCIDKENWNRLKETITQFLQ